MIKNLKELLDLPQDQKDALLVMAIDRLATEHRVYPSNMDIIERMTSGNFAHQICQIKINIKCFDELSVDFAKQANIDIDALANSDDFDYVLNKFNNTFPNK